MIREKKTSGIAIPNIVEIVKNWKEVIEPIAGDFLKKYDWLISPSLPADFSLKVIELKEKGQESQKNIDKLFVEYFSSNNFAAFEELVKNWESNPVFKPRMKIFQDCISVMKNANGIYNPSNVLLPTLIAQIDGVINKFMMTKGLSFDKKKRAWVDEKGEKITKKKWIKDYIPNDILLNLANDINFDILFQSATIGEPLKNHFTFSRHKILHGEELKYGKIDNTIRAFLILDFLAYITSQNY